MKEAHQIIRRPMVTEKSTRQKEENQYVFEGCGKPIKSNSEGIEKLFKVEGPSGQDLHCLGKMKRLGRKRGRGRTGKSHRHLKEGDRIDFFEGA
jgi:large subunit ribosomal protein L23